MIVPKRWRHNDHDREVIPNPSLIQWICILSGVNTQGMCWDVALITLGSVAF